MTDTPGQADDPRHLEALRDTRDSLAAHDIGGDRMVTLSTNVLGAAVADLNAVIAALTPAAPDQADDLRVALRHLVETHLMLITEVVDDTTAPRFSVIVDEDCTEVAMSARTLADHVVAGLAPAAPGHAAPGESPTWPTVKGRCPNCARSTLMLGDGGYVTCSASDCDDPGMADDLLRFAQRWGSRVRSVRLVAQLGGLGAEEVVGGAPRGVEPASQVLVPRLVPGECLTEGCVLVDQAHTYSECRTTPAEGTTP